MLEVADVFREAGPAYRERFGSCMLPSHLRAMRDIEHCRTRVLGGHLRRCDRCTALQYSYHSCRNRHCPKCQGNQTRVWLDRQRARLLPGGYFTLPDSIRRLARSHQKTVYAILLTAAASSLLELTADPRWLGARPAVLAVLHTWTRDLRFHPHAHLLVTAGGLTPDRQAWRRPTHRDFLIPCRALSVLFRGKVRDACDRARLLEQLPRNTWRRKWVVHAQHAGHGDQVLQYVARYVHRVAITNSRLLRFDRAQVSFRYRDSRSGQLLRATLGAEQFIARFLQHVLPARFTKVRYYGLLSPRCRNDLEQARALLQQSPEPTNNADDVDPRPESTDVRSVDPDPQDHLCPLCRLGVMKVIAALMPQPPAKNPNPRAPPVAQR